MIKNYWNQKSNGENQEGKVEKDWKIRPIRVNTKRMRNQRHKDLN